MTYIEPPQLQRPFKRGDSVQVMNRDHTICGTDHRVVYAGKNVVRIEDGRRYRATDGWWIGSNGTWPFPWLRHTPPGRVQLSRSKGWKLPPNTKIVARPSRWGNPYRVGDRGCDGTLYTAHMAVELFEHYAGPEMLAEGLLEPLRGMNLACWCKLGETCHADILLRLANTEGPSPGARLVRRL